VKAPEGLRVNRLAAYEDVIAEGKPITVAALTSRLGVSEATVRRDLAALEESGLVQRTHGGALPIDRGELPLPQRNMLQVAEKAAIGRVARTLVEEHDTIFLGGGSTTLQLAALLHDIELTVVTNSVPVMMQLAAEPKVHVIGIGGTLRRPELTMVGPRAVDAMRAYRARTAFLGVPALDAQHGFTADGDAEAATDAEFLSLCQQAVVLADHTKIGRVATTHVAPVSQIDMVITDSGASPEALKALRHTGAQVLVAEVTP
jgi:DeoR/GlpR family transcriptional regulator of sugar metabolism